MATRSLIGLLTEDKEVKNIYCHWDGYPSHNGKILVQHYNTLEKVTKLIALGSLSALEVRLEPKEGEKHTFENPVSDVTIAYHRDRGEELRINTSSSESGYWAKGGDIDFIYLFKDGEWYVDMGTSAKPRIAKVADVLSIPEEYEDED